MDFSGHQFADVVVAVPAGRVDPVAALTPIVGEIFAISCFDAVLDVRGSARAAPEEFSGTALAAYDAHRRSAAV